MTSSLQFACIFLAIINYFLMWGKNKSASKSLSTVQNTRITTSPLNLGQFEPGTRVGAPRQRGTVGVVLLFAANGPILLNPAAKLHVAHALRGLDLMLGSSLSRT